MSTLITEVKEGQIYTGYDKLADVQVCSPSFFGCSVCLGASVVDGYVALTISANTPLGNVSKTFKITSGGSFTWQPFSRFKVTITISNFGQQGNNFSFDLSLQGCIKLPLFGWKCISFSHHFVIPVALEINADELNEHELMARVAYHSLINQAEKTCNCH